MAKKKKQLTPLQQAYKKEMDRLLKGAKRYLQGGEKIVTQDMPKRVTKKLVETLQSLKPKAFLRESEVVNSQGKKNEGTETLRRASEERRQARQYRKAVEQFNLQQRSEDLKESQQKFNQGSSNNQSDSFNSILDDIYNTDYDQPYRPTSTKIILSQFRATISKYPKMAYPILTKWLDQLIADNGEDNVAEMLQEGADMGFVITYEVAYNESELYNYMDAMLTYMPDQGDLYREKIMEAMESVESGYDLDYESIRGED